jgi:3-oxoadipate enol-lactonase
MWDRQLTALSGFRLIRYDPRGHGRSDAPAGEYTLPQLGRDALAVLDAAGVARASFCGISMGGGVGQWLAAEAPARIDRLVLANTGPAFGSPDVWKARIQTVLSEGMGAVAPSVVDRWFTPEFRERDPVEVSRILAMLLACAPHGYAGCCAAIRDANLRPKLSQITAPTLVIGGGRDPATPPALAEELAAGIAGARLVMIDAAHLTPNERPDLFNAALSDFLG